MSKTGLTLALAAALLAGCGQNHETSGPQPETTSSASPSASATPPASEPSVQPSVQAQKLLAALPSPYNTGDIENGHRVFARCQVCHTTSEGGPNLIGPNLWGVFGRKVASKADFAYSDALKSKSWAWDASHLDAWIQNPREVAPGTKMSFAGLPDAKDRTDVIAYLKTATSK